VLLQHGPAAHLRRLQVCYAPKDLDRCEQIGSAADPSMAARGGQLVTMARSGLGQESFSEKRIFSRLACHVLRHVCRTCRLSHQHSASAA
jgi:hypothetical protein